MIIRYRFIGVEQKYGHCEREEKKGGERVRRGGGFGLMDQLRDVSYGNTSQSKPRREERRTE